MGIIRAVLTSADTVLREQWREFFACDALDVETLIRRGTKQIGAHSVNTRADDNVITNGSILSVADGQCVIVVSQGRIIDVCAEPGEHVFEDPNHPGGVGGFVQDVFTRVSFGGGDVQPIRHRIYYVNVKESHGNRLEAEPFALSVRDDNLNAVLDLSVQVGGVYSYRVADPTALYRQVVGNIEGAYQRRDLNVMVAALLRTAIPEALAELTEGGIRPYELPMRTEALQKAVIERVKAPLLERYGLELVSLAFDTLTVTDLAALQSAQRAAINRDPAMAAATLIDAAAEAVRNLNQ